MCINNYWRGEDFFVGDCMPFFCNGEWHLYYLRDVGHHNHPRVGVLGGHEWAHRSTRDFVTWRNHALALPLDFDSGEASNCTVSLFAYDVNVYAFYALRSTKFSGERFRMAVSEDGG